MNDGFQVIHDYLYWCYTEVRAQNIADWLGNIMINALESQLHSRKPELALVVPPLLSLATEVLKRPYIVASAFLLSWGTGNT